MDCRQLDAGFDIAAAAGWYSAIAGLLAGFALVALLLPLDHESDSADDEQAASAVVEFVCAFFSLVILAFAYAVLSGRLGDERAQAVAAHEQILFGPALSLATLLLLIGLYSVLGSYGGNRAVFRPARGVVLVATATLGPMIAVVLQFSNTLDVRQARSQLSAEESCGPLGIPADVTFNLVVVLVSVVVLLLVAAFRNRLPRWDWAGAGLAKAVLGFAGATVAWTSLAVPFISTATLSGATLEHVTLIAGSLAAVGFSIIAWSMRPLVQQVPTASMMSEPSQG